MRNRRTVSTAADCRVTAGRPAHGAQRREGEQGGVHGDERIERAGRAEQQSQPREAHDRGEDPGRAPGHVARHHALREERDHAVADGKEDRQQEAPERSTHCKVQHDVVGRPYAVAEPRRAHDADRKCGAGDDRVRDHLLGVDQHAQERDQSDGEAGGREHRCDGEQRGARVDADEPARRCSGEQQRGGHVRAARHQRSVHPARVGREQEAEEEGGEDGEQHQERVRPDRRHREVERKQREPV